MASQTAPPSRLVQMQLRFQQKQQQEREQLRKQQQEREQQQQQRHEVFGNTVKTKTESIMTVNHGKVRQMFDERRRGIGIDRSQPLKPITATGVTTTTIKNKSLSERSNGITTAPAGHSTTTTSMKKTEITRHVVKSNGYDDLDNTVLESYYEPSRSSSNASSQEEIYSNNNNNNRNEYEYEKNHNIESIKDKLNNNKVPNKLQTKTNKQSTTITPPLAPLVTKKIAPSSMKKTPLKPIPNLSLNSKNNNATTKSRSQQQTDALNNNNKMTNNSNKTTTAPVKKSFQSPTKMAQSIVALNAAPRVVPPSEGMATCPFCNRNFLSERLPKHKEVCQKLSKAKRKVFDASQHRVRGTEAEKYIKKAVKSGGNAQKSNATPTSSSKQNNWRQKHEEFIAAIRAAKQVKAHLARGGKLADLPPPPPSENPDYIQCPHCLRRFNQAAAERHIPKCANMLHNKPKPGAAKQSNTARRVSTRK